MAGAAMTVGPPTPLMPGMTTPHTRRRTSGSDIYAAAEGRGGYLRYPYSAVRPFGHTRQCVNVTGYILGIYKNYA